MTESKPTRKQLLQRIAGLEETITRVCREKQNLYIRATYLEAQLQDIHYQRNNDDGDEENDEEPEQPKKSRPVADDDFAPFIIRGDDT